MRGLQTVSLLAALVVATPALAQSHGRADGGIPPGRRAPARNVYMSNGQIVTINGRRCVQRTAMDGRVHTICADGDHDRDDRIVARAERAQNRAYNSWRKDKHRKHDNHRDYERDYDRHQDRSYDRDRERSDDRRSDHDRR